MVMRPQDYPSSDDLFVRLQRAGWSVGEVAVHGADGVWWLVSGTNGENAVNVRGRTEAEAWRKAALQAEAAGMGGSMKSLAANRSAALLLT